MHGHDINKSQRKKMVLEPIPPDTQGEYLNYVVQYSPDILNNMFIFKYLIFKSQIPDCGL